MHVKNLKDESEVLAKFPLQEGLYQASKTDSKTFIYLSV